MTSPFPSSSNFNALDEIKRVSDAKKELRRQIKTRLKTLVVDRVQTANALWKNLVSTFFFRSAQVVGVYLDFGTEAPTRPFLPRLFAEPQSVERTIAVPFCNGETLQFCRIDPPTFVAKPGAPLDEITNEVFFAGLAPGAFGILEPCEAFRNDPGRIVAPNDFDAVLVPGLAFDANGGRLGRGAGYYDRFLPSLSDKALLIGIAFDEQIVEKIPTTPLDFFVDAVVTPTRILKIDR